MDNKTVIRFGSLNGDPELLDTLSWRVLPETIGRYCFSTYGDSAAVWFDLSAACTLKIIRVHFDMCDPSGAGNVLLDVFESRYNGHILTTDSTNANGWIGTFEDGQWIPGWVMGHSPLGEHICGPFPLTVSEEIFDTWVEVPMSLLEEPYLSGESFFITINFFPFLDDFGISAESQNTVPYQFFHYYADHRGPDRTHDGWFLRSYSLWVEAIVRYAENTPPAINDMDVLNYTYASGPFSVAADIEDRDAENPSRAGVASAYLHWEINGVPDSAAMTGPQEGGIFTGQIPSITTGDEVRYYISALDDVGAEASNTPETFARLEPTNPQADILLVNYGSQVDQSDFYRQLLDSLGYMYEYWDVEKRQGIDRSVSTYGWRTAIIFGYNQWVPFHNIIPPLPTREYAGNIWADFLDAGIPEAPVNLFYAEYGYWLVNQEECDPEFQPGDFAYDYFACVALELCNCWGCTDRIMYGMPGDPISGDFADLPFRQISWPHSPISWFTYTSTTETGVDLFFTSADTGTGIRFDGGSFKTVFLPWMFDILLYGTDIDTVEPEPCDDVRVLMENVLEWFGTEQQKTGIDDPQVTSRPQHFTLSQNYPNPFNSKTDIRFQISGGGSPAHTTLKIYNVLGQEVRTLVDSNHMPGVRNVTWDGRDNSGRELPSGIYFYQLSVNGGRRSETKRMVLMK